VQQRKTAGILDDTPAELAILAEEFQITQAMLKPTFLWGVCAFVLELFFLVLQVPEPRVLVAHASRWYGSKGRCFRRRPCIKSSSFRRHHESRGPYGCAARRPRRIAT
jgi:hypothetical protein